MPRARDGILARKANLCACQNRYWPGRAPDWAQERDGGRSSDQDSDEDEVEAEVTAIAPPVVIKASEDPRLRRLAEVRARLIRNMCRACMAGCVPCRSYWQSLRLLIRNVAACHMSQMCRSCLLMQHYQLRSRLNPRRPDDHPLKCTTTDYAVGERAAEIERLSWRQRRDDDSDEQATTAAPRIISRHREVESSDDDDEVAGDVLRRVGDEGEGGEPEEDEDAMEARRAAVRERCAVLEGERAVHAGLSCE